MTVNATRRSTFVPAGVGDAVNIIGERITFKIGTPVSNGEFSLMVMDAFPLGGPPIHTHPSAEVFYVLEGEFKISVVEENGIVEHRALPGDSVYIPAGVAPTKSGERHPGENHSPLHTGRRYGAVLSRGRHALR
jgi:quercetin dioxygenase-like cupin family protein